MKYTTLFLLFVLNFVQGSDWKEKYKIFEEKYDRIKETCSQKLGIPIEELKHIEDLTAESTREKCTLECVFTEAGLMKDGRYAVNGSDVIEDFIFDYDELDAESIQMARDISRRCEKEVEKAKVEIGCETAGAIFSCLTRVTKQVAFKETKDYF